MPVRYVNGERQLKVCVKRLEIDIPTVHVVIGVAIIRSATYNRATCLLTTIVWEALPLGIIVVIHQ